MHILVRVLVVCLIANAGLGQPCPNELDRCVRINKLVIESKRLPVADRERIIRLFEQKSYAEGEVGIRIQYALRKVGYYKAVVDEPTFAFPTKGKAIANVTVKMEPGAQYRLGEIRFRRATVFPAAQLRSVFLLRRGELFDSTKFSRGLDDLRKLYGTRGYVNTVVN